MTAFFHAIIRRETTLSDTAALKLAAALGKPINRMLVSDAADLPQTSPAVAAMPDPPANALHSPQPETTAAPPLPPGAPAEPFDPYAFSAVVVFSKTGKSGLAKRLAEIKKSEHLYAFADAQHLGVERGLKKSEDIRKAIIAATERRLANRKAAAS